MDNPYEHHLIQTFFSPSIIILQKKLEFSMIVPNQKGESKPQILDVIDSSPHNNKLIQYSRQSTKATSKENEKTKNLDSLTCQSENEGQSGATSREIEAFFRYILIPFLHVCSFSFLSFFFFLRESPLFSSSLCAFCEFLCFDSVLAE